MADYKKSFILHIDSLDILDDLDDKNTAELFRAIRDYNKCGETNLEGIMKAVFNPFKNQFDRDLEKYAGIVERNKSNGSKGGRPAKESKEIEPKKPTGLSGLFEEPKKADNDNDSDSVNESDNDSVNDSVNESEIKKKEYSPNGLVDLKNQPNPPKIDFDKLLSFFNSNRGILPEVKKMSDVRKKRILSLQKQHGKESIQIVIEKVRDSNFLQGDNKENWAASFDWIFKPANFIKILEDNYANRENYRNNNLNANHKQDAVNAVNEMFGRKKAYVFDAERIIKEHGQKFNLNQ